MLKRVKLKNFVNFKRIQTLEVGEGVFTVVGANGSGKSTVFEAIRRCSEVQINDSISSRKENEYSLVMCLFEKPVSDSQRQNNGTQRQDNDTQRQDNDTQTQDNDTQRQDNDTQTQDNDTQRQDNDTQTQDNDTQTKGNDIQTQDNDTQTQDNDTMVSYYMVWKDQEGQSAVPNDNSADSGSKDAITFVAVKVLVTRVKNKSDDHYLVWSGWNDVDKKVSDWKAYQDPSLNELEKKELLEFATSKETDTKYNEVADILKQIHQRQKIENKTELKVENKTEFDDKFQRFTDIEFLFNHRGISPIQSSQQLIDIPKSLKSKESRYKRGTENAYIIRRFLEKRKDAVVYDKQMEEEEEDVFRLITSESYKFTLEDNQIFVEPEDTPLSKKAPLLKMSSKKAPLLKMSEGTVEAKCISILLSKKGPRTLILEEPGHGMHKNYVDSMVNRVFLDDRFTSKKTIILSTHNRDFLTTKTLRHTFFFRRNAKGESVINQLTKPHDIKTLAFFSSADVSTIFFSKRTLFVEGKSDYMFVTMIKEILLQGSSSTRLVQKICGDDEVDQDKFKYFLATLNIIDEGGVKEIKKAEEICKTLGITSRLFLIDGDQRDTFRDKLDLKEGDDDSFVFLWKCKCPDEKKQTKSNYTFVTMIKEILLQGSTRTRLAQKICGDDKVAQDKFKDFLATIYKIIDESRAKEMKKKAEDICKDLGLKSRLFLIDGDQRDTFRDELGLKEGDNDKKAEEEELHPKKEKHESRPEEEEEEKLHPKKEKHESRPEEEKLHPKKENREGRPWEKEMHPNKEKHKDGDLEDALLNLAWTHDKEYHRGNQSSCEFKECEGMQKCPILQFKKKAFLQQGLEQEDIYSGMELVIKVAVDLPPETCEVRRFLEFLKDHSKGSCQRLDSPHRSRQGAC